MSSREEWKAIRRILKKNPRYQQFLENFRGNPAYNIDFEEFHQELQRLHTTRLTRELKRKKSRSFPEKALDAMLQDQSTRSRCAEILGQCTKISSAMDRNLSKLRDYLCSEYSDSLKRVGTQVERKSFVEALMRDFYDFFDEVKTLEKSASIVIEDIDKANYMFKNLVEIIKVLSRPEQVIL
jgi:hypothetical protein